MTEKINVRDNYVDFMRGFGLLLLVVAHTWAPLWLARIRVFDVPMMVFISAMCYKSLRGGYLRYGAKRFKRICYPVFIFLTIFFAAAAGCYFILGRMPFGITPDKIIGSYLLLNNPSIGYVWIMRVFLLMALVLPFLDRVLEGVRPLWVIIVALSLIVVQHVVVRVVGMIDNKYVYFVVVQIVPYLTGYSAIAIVGLKIKEFGTRELVTTVAVFTAVVVFYVIYNGVGFSPQMFKYPPMSLYLAYGILGSVIVWSLRPLLAKYVTSRAWSYLSVNSMWLYLWHIVPVYMITPLAGVANFWFARFCIVLAGALLLNYAYDRVASRLGALLGRR